MVSEQEIINRFNAKLEAPKVRVELDLTAVEMQMLVDIDNDLRDSVGFEVMHLRNKIRDAVLIALRKEMSTE